MGRSWRVLHSQGHNFAFRVMPSLRFTLTEDSTTSIVVSAICWDILKIHLTWLWSSLEYGSAVGIVTCLQAGRLSNCGSMWYLARNFSLLKTGYWEPFSSEYGGRGVKLTTDLPMLTRLTILRSVPPLLHISSWSRISFSIETALRLLTSWSRVLLEKQIGSQQVKKFPAFYETSKFITSSTGDRHLSLS